MKIKPSNTATSSILAMGKRLHDASKATGQEYLLLNRGVNSVVPINLEPVVEQIDFNSMDIQAYPGSKGKVELRKAINNEYFKGQADLNNILITGGGISGLDITLQNIETDELLLPHFYWGTYGQLCQLRNIRFSDYPDYDFLEKNAPRLKNKAVIICDPGNPLGEKFNDSDLISTIKTLDKNGCTVIIDSPYRRLFFDDTDTFYQQISQLSHVIIIESFSKSLGLSGQRIGFMYSNNSEFNKEALLRLTYATNGINSFAQILVTKLLATPEGKKAVTDFKKTTTHHIAKNLTFLSEHNLLAKQFYKNTTPMGIFCAINKPSGELFKNRIGSVELSYFALQKTETLNNISRILISVPHEKFVSFFRTII